MDDFGTTRNVPSQFLKDMYLVGVVPRRALKFDPRISYALYIPPKHYNPDPPPNQAGDRPLPTACKLPLLVYVHGTRRKSSPMETDLVPFADATPCAILAPLFPAGLDDPYDTHSYKLLRSRTVQSDRALLSMFDEVAHSWPGIETEKVYMMGFSGGGQFAHRFLYIHPERLAAVSVGAPGRTTVLDSHQNWPTGTADVEALFGKPVNIDLVSQVRIQLVIGSEDNTIHGGKDLWAWLANANLKKKKTGTDSEVQKHGELPPMARGRLDSLRLLQTSWTDHGIEAEFVVVEGAAHSTEAAREPALGFLQPLMHQAAVRP